VQVETKERLRVGGSAARLTEADGRLARREASVRSKVRKEGVSMGAVVRMGKQRSEESAAVGVGVGVGSGR